MPDNNTLTPEEIALLIDSGEFTSKDIPLLPHASRAAAVFQLAKKYPHGAEGDEPIGDSNPLGMLPLSSIASGGGKLLEMLKGAGGISGAVKGAGSAVKTGALGYAGMEGARALGQSLGLPPALVNLLGFAGAHVGGSMGGGAAAEEEAALPGMSKSMQERVVTKPAQTDAEYMAQTGKPRLGTPDRVAADNPPPPELPYSMQAASSTSPRRGMVAAGTPNRPIEVSVPSESVVGNEPPPSLSRQGSAQGVSRLRNPDGSTTGGVSVDTSGSPTRRGSAQGVSRLRNPDGSTTGGMNVRPPQEAEPGNFDPREFPPGTNEGTDPDTFLRKSNDFSNSQVPKSAVDAVQSKISSRLKPAGAGSKRKPSSDQAMMDELAALVQQIYGKPK